MPNRRNYLAPGLTLVLLLVILILNTGCGSSALSSSTSLPSPTQVSSNGITNSSSSGSANGNTGNNVVSNPNGNLPQLATKPQPVTGTYQGCPPQGDGGDAQLNLRKNRTDTAQWYPVSISSLLNLRWPQTIEVKKRASWSQTDAAEIARYEGIPIQLEGWLAGAKQEGPESPNCHAADDVDNHLWIVDDPTKDRSKAVVVEITPRIRVSHPGWAFERISPLVDGRTKVRISGWLMMDQEHPDQVGKTRGTIWEIHPIMAFDVQRGGNWVSLDTGRVAVGTNTKAENVPTLASLPPDIEEPADEASIPTATPRPSSSRSGGRTTASGGVKIDDISYQGSGATDEYVEISNSGTNAVNLDGWVLRDVYGGQEFTWSGFTLRAGQKIRVYTSESHPESGGFSFGSKSAVWRNKGDAAELLDKNSMVVSSFAYGDKR